MEKLRIGVAGAGAIAQRNAREAENSGVAKVSGVFDVNTRVAHDLAKALGANTASSYEELLSDDNTDAILLNVPHHLHRPMAVEAANAGKHVMIEKPMANNLAEAEEIIQACHGNNVKCTVNYSFRFLPKIIKARQLVADGALGDLSGIQLIDHQYKDRGYWTGARSNSPGDWRASKEKCGGGYLIMNVCHILDYSFFILGCSPDRVYAEYATLASPAEVEDIITVSFRMDNGAVGSICASSIMRGMGQTEQRFWGTNGSLKLDGPGLQFYSTRPIDGKRPGRTHEIKKFPSLSWTAEWVKDFVAAVQEDREPQVGIREGWDNLAFIEAAYESMEKQKPVKIKGLPTNE